ncbi:MAG: hypothetical protein K2M89_06565 [Clostridiales bacterium]|nr:hypothetical protein [Clostridiales bacterium]
MKKLRRVLLIVFVVSALALALVACNETAITEHNHRWSEWSVDTATCTQGGTQTRTCTSEGCKAQVGKPATETRTTNALGHNVTSWTHCESDHSKHEGVCSRTDCGVTVTEAHHANAAGTECVNCGAALGGSEQCLHPNASTTSETAATCTSAKIEHWTCPDCVWTEDRTVGTALGHDYTDVAWTPVAGGTHERECARGCGDKQTGTCDNKDVLTGTAATCEAAGRENGTKCSVCGGNETLGEVINALGHDYTNVAWTPVAGGTHERVCAHGCGDKQTGTCDDNDVITGTAATCETAGRENGTKCSVCGGNETLGEVINALGHDEYKTDETAATCTTNKVEHWACHRCDWTDDKEIADTALGHDEYKAT